MRTLKFIVEGQIIRPDPNCDFSNLIPGTDGYLQAEFVFSEEWKGTSKVVGFYSMMGVEYPPQELSHKNTCKIPAEALKREKFKLQVFGIRGIDFRIMTNRVTVSQNGGDA